MNNTDMILKKIDDFYRKALDNNNMNPQYELAIKYMKEAGFDIKNKTICEFGVFCGNTMVYTHELFNKYNIYPYNYLGFDSFVGLPETGITGTQEQIKNGLWVKGQFSAQSFMQVDNVDNVKDIILKRILNKKTIIELIDGYYADVLNSNILNKFHKICWIDIDSDLYESAREILNFVFSNNLVEKNSLISYDDGEKSAHKEIEELYNVDFKEIPCGDNSTCLFIIKNIGGKNEN